MTAQPLIERAKALPPVEPGDSAVIATANTRHLGRFPGVEARLWSDTRA